MEPSRRAGPSLTGRIYIRASPRSQWVPESSFSFWSDGVWNALCVNYHSVMWTSASQPNLHIFSFQSPRIQFERDYLNGPYRLIASAELQLEPDVFLCFYSRASASLNNSETWKNTYAFLLQGHRNVMDQLCVVISRVLLGAGSWKVLKTRIIPCDTPVCACKAHFFPW